MLAPGLERGTVVLDLACGDGGLAGFVVERGLRYRGVDLNDAMVGAARSAGVEVERGDLNDYVPAQPVAATTVFRALYYAHDRRAFFHHVAGYTERKIVFDVNPRQYDLAEVTRDLADAGFARVVARPFFVPQRVSLPEPVATAARAAERIPPLARAILRLRFTYVVTGFRAPS